MKRFLLLCLASGVMWAQNAGTPMSLVSIIDDGLLPNGGAVGGDCTNYSVAYFNVVLGHSVACVNTNPLNVTNVGKWTVTGGGGAGTSYLAGTGLTLTGTTFSVKYGAAAATATEGNDPRIGAGGTGSATVPIGGSSANRPATTPGTSSLFIQTDRNVGDQFSYYNGTAWYYPGAVDATMTRDAATGTMGVNPNSVPRLGAVNNFTANNTITTAGPIPLQLSSTSAKTVFYVTNANSGASTTHDWDMSTDATGNFVIWDDTANSAIYTRSTDGTQITISGGLNVNASNLAKPTCAAGIRGMLWFVNGGAAADGYQACLYNGTAYTWRNFTIP
jgi:hypothetical protein